MKQDVAQQLPKSWEIVSFDDVCEFFAGFGFPKDMQGRTGKDIPFYKVRDISVAWQSGSKTLLATDNTLSLAEAKSIKATPLPVDTIVFPKIGEALRLNRRAMLASPALVDNNVMGILGHEGLVDSKYLYWYSSVTRFDAGARASVVPSIRKSDVGELPFPLAPLPEQTRIVEKLEELLSELDAGVAELKAAQRKLAQYRQSLLKAAVEGSLTADWRAAQARRGEPQETGAELLQRILTERRARWEAKQLAKFAEQGKVPPKGWKSKYPEPTSPDVTALPILPAGWTYATVDQLSLTQKYGTSSKTSEDRKGVPVLRMGNIQDGELDLGVLKYLPQDHPEFPELFLANGDILFNRTNSPELVGKTAVYRSQVTPCSYASYLISVTPSQSCSPEFISAYINSIYGRQWVKSVVTQQVGQANVNGSKLAALVVPLPPMNEQTEITTLLLEQRRESFVQESMIERGLQQAAAQRKNILKAAFSGKLVPQDPHDEPASILLQRIRTDRAARGDIGKKRTRKAKEAV